MVLPLSFVVAALAAAVPQTPEAARLQQAPIAFVANAGQWHPAVAYRARFGALTAFVETNGFLLDCRRDLPREFEPLPPATEIRHAALRWSFSGQPRVVAAERPLAGRHSFFVGGAENWRADVGACEAVRYDEVLEGIDVVVYAKDRHFEYDVDCGPGCDLAAFAITITGAEGLTLRADGAMVVRTAVGDVLQTAPIAFAVAADGTRREVRAQFELRGENRFGFRADWSGEDRLVIDPGVLYGTYIGGSGTENCAAVHVDSDGVMTFAGTTQSANYPLSTGAYSTNLQAQDVYVSRIDPAQAPASQLVLSTLLGGSGTDNVAHVTADEFGLLWVAGATQSSNFPATADAFQATHGGGTDAFLVLLNPFATGTGQLWYSTFLGGSGNDSLLGFALANGTATLAGSTTSGSFPTTTNAWRQIYAGGSSDGWVAQLSPWLPPGNQLLYSSLFGDSGQDVARAVHTDGGLVTITGNTASSAFPLTADAMQPVFGGGSGDAFVLQLDPNQAPAAQLVYSSFLGGSGSEFGQGVHVDDTGVITLFGSSMSTDFPTTPGAFSVALNGTGSDAYIVRLQPALPPAQQMLYSTLAGGSAGESVTRCVVDEAGVVTFCGGGSSPDFPTTPGALFGAPPGGANDGYVCRIDPSRPQAQQLVYSTYVGGPAQDGTLALAANDLGQIVVVGFTQSTTFPITANAFSSSPSGLADTFVVKLDMLPTGVTSFGDYTTGCNGAIAASVASNPSLANPWFEFTCLGMQSPAVGMLAFSLGSLSSPIPVFGASMWLDPAGWVFANVLLTAPGERQAHAPMPIPAAGNWATVGLQFHAQFFWLEPAGASPCPIEGLSASNALTVEVQP
ncbi:MAG: hypothetical protein JNK78_03410 [Planctomycetes bacterium]|nr:hypothetical protein [Planctomycetota bacterium]